CSLTTFWPPSLAPGTARRKPSPPPPHKEDIVMLRKADTSATAAVVFALGFFFIGGVLTTVVPPLVDKSWARPFHNTDPAKGPTGELKPYTEQQLKGRAVYVRQ